MDVIGQHLDMLDAHWLTFGNLNRGRGQRESHAIFSVGSVGIP